MRRETHGWVEAAQPKERQAMTDFCSLYSMVASTVDTSTTAVVLASMQVTHGCSCAMQNTECG